MTGSKWRDGRLGLIVAGLAILAGTPAILVAADVRNARVLAGATAAAAIVVALGAVWQERYRMAFQRKDAQSLRTEDGCLVLAGGGLPRVRDVASPLLLGVHQAAPGPARADDAWHAVENVPVYVPRDADAELREALAAGGFVLVIGDSTAGKSRAAFEAMTATLGGHLLICPNDRKAIPIAVTRAAQARQCVLWLDDLEGYLGDGGLTSAQLGRLISGGGHHRVVVATLRAAEQARITADGSPRDDDARQLQRDIRQVLGQARSIRIPRLFTQPELERARARDWDPRIARALASSGAYGIAEYLAAGPDLLRDWEDALHSAAGPHARGAALVAAAIDIRRAGYTEPAPRALLDQVHEHYLSDPEHARTPREPLAEAWMWATRQHATTAMLQPAANGSVEVFDYLVDVVQRRSMAADHVPEHVIRAAIVTAEAADLDSLAATAFAQGRYFLAELAYRHASQAKAARADLGPEHPDTLASRDQHAYVLRELGQLDEAEAEHRVILAIQERDLGEEHPDALASRNNLGRLMRDRGKSDEAETELRAVLDVRGRVLGKEHPDTLASRHVLALNLTDLWKLAEAEAEHRAVLNAQRRVLGKEHRETLISQDYRAVVLANLGRLDEAEAEHSAALEALERVHGTEHPATLDSRQNRAYVLMKLGQLEKAEAELRDVLDGSVRVLGPEHPSVVDCRNSHALVMREMGRLDEAEAEQAVVAELAPRVWGPEHPNTLTCRVNHARILARLGRLEAAEAEHRAVLAISQRVRGAEHAETLFTRNSRAEVLARMGRLDEAETEHRIVLAASIRVLGNDHPDTVTCRENLAAVQAALEDRSQKRC